MINSAGYGLRTVDSLLEQKYAKMLATPFLDMTEKSISYLIPDEKSITSQQQDEEVILDETNTLKRIFDINRRVIQHTYQATYNQIIKLDRQYNFILEKLKQLKQFSDIITSNVSVVCEGGKNSLKSICAGYVDFDSLSLEVSSIVGLKLSFYFLLLFFLFVQKLEGLGKIYYKAILGDVDSMLNRYTEALKNLPIVSSGTDKLKQTTMEIISKFNEVRKYFLLPK